MGQSADSGKTLDELRRQVRRIGVRLRSTANECRALTRQLPEVSEAILSLDKAPDMAATLSMALDQALDELPEVAEVLERASTATPASLEAEHQRLVKTMQEADILYRGREDA